MKTKNEDYFKREKPIFIWLCLNCEKNFDSKNRIIKRLNKPVGLVNSVMLCPNCKNDKHKLIIVVNEFGKELIYRKSNKWIKGIGFNDGYYLK